MSLAGQISIVEKEDYFIINLFGKFIGSEETENLKFELEKKADSQNYKAILNFENVSYFSSLALGILVKEDEKYSINKGKLIICNVPGFLESIFTLTKLTSILTIVKTFEEAERALLIS